MGSVSGEGLALPALLCFHRGVSNRGGNTMDQDRDLLAVVLGLILIFSAINALYTARAAYYLRKIEQALRKDP